MRVLQGRARRGAGAVPGPRTSTSAATRRRRTQWQRAPARAGADRASSASRTRTSCRAGSSARSTRYLTARGRRIMVGWDEILEGGLAEGAVVMSWRGDEGGIAAARAGHDVVIGPEPYVYLDWYQAPSDSGEPLAIHPDRLHRRSQDVQLRPRSGGADRGAARATCSARRATSGRSTSRRRSTRSTCSSRGSAPIAEVVWSSGRAGLRGVRAAPARAPPAPRRRSGELPAARRARPRVSAPRWANPLDADRPTL